MLHLGRPWDRRAVADGKFGPNDCLVSEVRGEAPKNGGHSKLMSARLQDGPVELILHPYPKSSNAQRPDRIGFPVRPRVVKEHETPEDMQAGELLRRMNEVLARVAKRVLREFEDSLGSTYTKFQYAPMLLVGLLRWRVVEPFALVEGQDPIADKLARAVEKTLVDLRHKNRARALARYGRILEQVLEELRGEGSNPELLLDIYGGADGEDADD